MSTRARLENNGVTYAKEGYLKKDHQERFTLKKGRFVNAWRIVDDAGADIVQPWSDTRKEALETATALGIKIKGVKA